MSDDYVEQGQYDAPVEGQADVVDGAEAVDAPLLEIDQYSNYRVPVKIDGTEDYVPLAEAVAGYQRQADYTRKTQELAQQRTDLGWATAIRAALESDPVSTISMLSQHFGVQPAVQPQQAPQPQVDSFDPWLQEDEGWGQQAQQRVDPRLTQIEQRLAQYEQAEADRRLNSEIARLQATFPDFDPTITIAQAMRMGSTDLEAAYKQLKFDQVWNEKQQLEARIRQAEEQRGRKQSAAIVEGGATTSGAGMSDVGSVRSVTEAWEAAKRQLSK